jgi:hypothetical protein|tara:strand:+ start:466 stop:1017 length:552 start_codon:yes stop_codon:yes gene_type:complete
MANGTLKVSNIQTSSGSGTITLGQSGETISIPSGVTLTGVAGQANDPSFHAYNPQNGSIDSGTDVVISNNTELFDSSSAYDTTTYKFTPQVAGYYFLYSNVRYQSGDAQFDRINLVITKNGSAILAARNGHQDYTTCNVSGIVQANGSSDYFQMTSYHGKGSAVSITQDDEYTYFGGFLVKKS